MFLCETCHEKTKCPNLIIHPGSHGRCEDCGETADCVDCHYHHRCTDQVKKDLAPREKVITGIDPDLLSYLERINGEYSGVLEFRVIVDTEKEPYCVQYRVVEQDDKNWIERHRAPSIQRLIGYLKGGADLSGWSA